MSYGVDLRPRFDALGTHRLAPAELQENLGLAVARAGAHSLDAGKGSKRFLERAGNQPFDFFRRGSRVRHLNEDSGEFDVREFLQRQQARRNYADERQRDEYDDRRHRASQRDFGVLHRAARAGSDEVTCQRLRSIRE